VAVAGVRLRFAPAGLPVGELRSEGDVVLKELQERAKRYLSRPAPRTPEQTRTSAADARHDRAGAIAALQQTVSRLQHEIADLSRATDGATAPPTGGNGEPAPDAARLSTLHAELRRSQQDLAQYQGRV